MILTAYIGNSNIVVGCAEPGTKKIIFEEKISTDREKTSAEYAIIVKTILEIHGIDPKDLEGGIISSSVPPVTEPVREGIERLLDKKMIEVGPGIKTGVDIKLDDPAQLGADLQHAADGFLIEMRSAGAEHFCRKRAFGSSPDIRAGTPH